MNFSEGGGEDFDRLLSNTCTLKKDNQKFNKKI